MIERFIVPAAAPPPPGVQYSHAVMAGGWLHVTGQLPIDPDSPERDLPRSIEDQTELVFRNLRIIVEAAGYTLADTLFVRIYLTEFDRDYSGLNRVYHRYFADRESLPSRTTIGVAKLGRSALVEIDAVLYRAGV
jgi:2-iminobutanoate/2-iminopropanoate deaminase